MLTTNYSSAYSIHFIIMKEHGQDLFRKQKKKGRTRDVLYNACMHMYDYKIQTFWQMLDQYGKKENKYACMYVHALYIITKTRPFGR